MQLSLNPFEVSMIFWVLVGLVIGFILARLGPARRRLANAQQEIGRTRAEIEARDARIATLERELAAARDQVRPLSDEVDRLRRENARRVAAPPPSVDMSGAALAGGAMAPTVPAEEPGAPQPTELLPPFLDAPRGTPDNLMLMKGVGGRFAARLNEIGVFHFRQIASWSPEEVRIADSKLDTFRGRIERDQLVEQAKLLAAGRTTEYEARFGRLGE